MSILEHDEATDQFHAYGDGSVNHAIRSLDELDTSNEENMFEFHRRVV